MYYVLIVMWEYTSMRVSCRTTSDDIVRCRWVVPCHPTSCVKASSAVVRCRAQCEHRISQTATCEGTAWNAMLHSKNWPAGKLSQIQLSINSCSSGTYHCLKQKEFTLEYMCHAVWKLCCVGIGKLGLNCNKEHTISISIIMAIIILISINDQQSHSQHTNCSQIMLRSLNWERIYAENIWELIPSQTDRLVDKLILTGCWRSFLIPAKSHHMFSASASSYFYLWFYK